MHPAHAVVQKARAMLEGLGSKLLQLNLSPLKNKFNIM